MLEDLKTGLNREIQIHGLLRLWQVLAFVPVSRSHWWAGVKDGRYPKPIKLSARVTVWRASDILNLVEGIQQRHLSNHNMQK